MRASLLIMLFILLGMCSCRTEGKKEAIVDITTYSYEDIEYPKTAIQIPDSVKNKFGENFFLPWEKSPQELFSSLDMLAGKKISYLEKYLDDDAWYGENKKPHKRVHRQKIVENADVQTFPNFQKTGITISHTDLRRIPTNRPGFDTYSKAGEGYPFDYFQETALWANTPVFIAHISKDKQWCYVISPYYKGWVSMRDIAVVDEDFVQQWSSVGYCFPLSDGVSLTESNSNYAVNAKIGMVLPFEEISNNPESVLVYYANSDENQNAKILKAEVARSSLAFDDFQFNGPNLKQLVAELAGKPYGWGGNLENRDCSSMIRDLLGTFRIWLPRDSKDQMSIGDKYEFPETTDEKVRLIQEKGIPFLTILRKKGHNMLYVGDAPNGEPLILHAIWGLKTSYTNEQLAHFLDQYPIEGIHQEEDGKLKGRYIIGESVITSVHIGTENSDIPIPLIDEMYTMTNVLGN